MMSAWVFCLLDAECKGVFLPDHARLGMFFPDDECQYICLPDNVRHGILPSRCRVSGHISSR